MGAPPFSVKKRQKLLLFDFLWVKNGTRKNPATAGFSACGGALQRHNSPPPQCDPARRAFCFTGKFNEVSCKAKKRTALGQFSLPVMYGYEKIFRFVSRRLRRVHRQLRCPVLSDRHGSYLLPQSFWLSLLHIVLKRVHQSPDLPRR